MSIFYLKGNVSGVVAGANTFVDEQANEVILPAKALVRRVILSAQNAAPEPTISIGYTANTSAILPASASVTTGMLAEDYMYNASSHSGVDTNYVVKLYSSADNLNAVLHVIIEYALFDNMY